MIVTSKSFKHENKCLNCGKGQLDHRASDGACPIGSTRGNFTQYNELGQVFKDSGKPTIRSNRQYKKLIEDETRRTESLASSEREKNKVRAMTLHEVVSEMRALIRRYTGLGCEVENRYGDDSVEIHLVANGVRLGYTSATKTSLGSYIVAGSSAGCFMANGSDRDITVVMRQAFRDLEERANKVKGE